MAAAGIPLAALRANLDRGWPTGAHWSIGGSLREAVLVQPVGAPVGFFLRTEGRQRRLRLRGEVSLEAGARSRAAVGARICSRDGAGAETVVWTATLRRIGRRSFPSRHRIDATFDLPGEGEFLFCVRGTAGEALRWSRCEIGIEDGIRQPPASRPPMGGSPRPRAEREGGRGGTPRFSILTPVHDPPPEVLRETISSVRAQTFADWELCLVDDGSSDPRVVRLLEHAADDDSRVRLLRSKTASGISAATNAALDLARGEYIALLDHDDLLMPDALAEVDRALQASPTTDVLYSDEQLLTEDGPGHVFTKPHWSPDLLRSQMYICHLGVYRRSLAEEIGGFRAAFDGSQDFDFALRISERTDRILHIPRVLYRWRVHAGSSAGSTQAKPAAYPAARRAIIEHLDRTGVDGEVYFGAWQGIYRVVHRVPPGTRVVVGVVGERLREAPPWLLAAVADETSSGVAGVSAAVGPSAAAIVAEHHDADVIVLCAGEVEPLTRFWLARLTGFALQEGVAAVGARTVAPDGRVEDGALAVEEGLPVPVLYAHDAGDPGPLGIGLLPANAAAASGVVALGAAAVDRLGKPAPEFGALAVADFCLRAPGAGMRVVSVPDVLLRRSGGGAPANDLVELERFRRRWASRYPRDPYLELSGGTADGGAGGAIG